MTDLRTAAQQALEVLTLVQTDVEWQLNSPTRKVCRKAEISLKAALKCCCGEPESPGVIHRTDAPCFLIQDDTALLRQCLEALNRSDYLGWQCNLSLIKELKERLR